MNGLCIVVVLVGFTGCRTLRRDRQTQQLSKARFSSLQGAEKLQQGKFQDAEMLFAAALQHSPADERAHWGMAEVLWEQGDASEALTHMSTATEISGGSPDLLVRLGEMHLSEDSLDEALAYAEQAIQGQRDHSGAWALRGEVLQRREDLHAAMECYHRALQIRESYPKVQVALADIYQQVGRPQRALGTLNAMLDSRTLEEVPATAWFLKGQALADLGETGEARNCMREAALCANEQENDLLIEVAECQIGFGDLAEARVCLGRAQQHDPQNPNLQRVKSVLDQSFQSFSSNATLAGFAVPQE